jgi:hypothetical protein
MELQTKEEIKAWLNKYEVKNYTINDNLTVDVSGNVNLFNKQLEEIPFKFGIVNGTFDCSYNELTSLEFSPNKVVGYFDCNHNKLTSLEFCPQKVSGHFICSYNELTSLEFCPKEVGVDFDCSYNQLNDLLYIPSEVKEKVYLEANKSLGKYQEIRLYEDLMKANKLYKLEKELSNKLSINKKKINKVKVKI